MKLLIGADKVDCWKRSTWEGALKGKRIIVSTHQILHDALAHGFVNMNMLALIVFDEGMLFSKPLSRNPKYGMPLLTKRIS
jgi:hypothetical protein